MTRMAVSTRPALDAHALRADFPVFEQPVHGKPLAFLDSAASAQKPRQVLDALHRAVDELLAAAGTERSAVPTEMPGGH